MAAAHSRYRVCVGRKRPSGGGREARLPISRRFLHEPTIITRARVLGSSSGRELFAGCASTMPSLALIARSEANKYVYHQEKSGASSSSRHLDLDTEGDCVLIFPCLASMRSEITLDIHDINFGTTISENSENHTGKPLAASAFNRVHYNNNRRAHTDRSPLITP